MSKPYDATTKTLLEAGPEAWLALAGRTPDGPVTPLDTDVSTVSAAVDGAFRVDGPSPWLAHFEFQTSRDPLLATRLWRYNTLLDQHHGFPALSIAVLLRPKADGPDLTGVFQRRLPDGSVCHEFRHAVVRVWELPAERLLQGGLATLPLAPVANLGGAPLLDTLQRIDRRLKEEAPPDQAEQYWAATSVLLGLIHPRGFLKEFYSGGRFMDFLKESETYHWIFGEGREEGQAEGAIRILLKVGRPRFGAPTAETVAALEGIKDVSRLEDLSERLILVGSWEELLAPPVPTEHQVVEPE